MIDLIIELAAMVGGTAVVALAIIILLEDHEYLLERGQKHDLPTPT